MGAPIESYLSKFPDCYGHFETAISQNTSQWLPQKKSQRKISMLSANIGNVEFC